MLSHHFGQLVAVLVRHAICGQKKNEFPLYLSLTRTYIHTRKIDRARESERKRERARGGGRERVRARESESERERSECDRKADRQSERE